MRKIGLSLTGILLLSIFMLAGCGTGPQQTSVAETGSFAIDFTKAPNVIGFIATGRPTDGVQSLNDPDDPDDGELTIEAWVKTKEHLINKNLTPAAIRPFGSIFAIGSDFEGIQLWIDSNQQASFSMVDFPGPSSADSRRHDIKSASLDGDGVLDESNTWYHIAAVLVNEDHLNTHKQCDPVDKNGDTVDDRRETPHVDIYLNGEFDNCGSTDETHTGPLEYVRRGDNPTDGELDCNGDEGIDYELADGVCYPLNEHGDRFKFAGVIGQFPGDWWWPSGAIDRPKPDRRFVGIIDEVRFWNVARTANQILENYKREIGPQNGLIGYWRFNEGEGNIVLDSSGSGKGGVKMYCNVPGELVWWDNPITGQNEVFTKAGSGCAGPAGNAIEWKDGWIEMDPEKDIGDWKN